MNQDTNKRDKQSKKKLAQYMTRVGVGVLLAMWGVINLVTNYLYWARENELPDDIQAGDWKTASIFIVVTGLVPLLVGVWMMYRSMDVVQAGKKP